MPAPTETTPSPDKPWLSLVPLRGRDNWWAAGSADNTIGHIDETIEAGKDIEALIILQDCNIGGQYYRYFWWVKGDETRRRYCEITSTWLLDTPEGVDEIPRGSTETVTFGGHYKLRLSPTNCSDFFKVFERVHE